MTVWVIYAVYAAGFVMTWRRAAWVLARDEGVDAADVTGDAIVFYMVFGGFIALVWPVVVPGYWVYRSGVLTSPARGFFRAPRSVRREVEQDERERDLMEREARIRQLEREVGIS